LEPYVPIGAIVSGGATCPTCQGPLRTGRVCPRGLVCPHCHGPLVEVTLDDLDATEVDAPRKSNRARWVVVALLLLLVSGLVACFLVPYLVK
jgi:hypothetical protein